jgi:hypothetical protein
MDSIDDGDSSLLEDVSLVLNNQANVADQLYSLEEESKHDFHHIHH